MKITIVGTGYVGLVSGACLAELGAEVTCIDVDQRKIDTLNSGQIPIYEPGLGEVVQRGVSAGQLRFSTDFRASLPGTELVFSAVGTPPDENGSADLHYVLEVARQFGQAIDHYAVLVTKSTVPVGTAEKVRQVVANELAKRGADVPFDVASNPEFLKEGNAVQDFLKPDRVVVGVDSDRAREALTRLYRPLMLNNFRVIFTDIASAEMIKYAANAMLATRISFMNEVANLCERVGADVSAVRQGIGADPRIGCKFLYPGCGYGGSCFPKDVKALIHSAAELGCDMRVLRAVEEVNEEQKSLMYRKLQSFYPDGLRGRRVTLWGLAFKPETDDMREATALAMIGLLREAGARVTVYDPVALNECRRRVGDAVEYAADMYDALRDADALVMLTEWKQFRMPNWERVAALMRRPLVLDGRNIYDAADLRARGFDYAGVGRP